MYRFPCESKTLTPSVRNYKPYQGISDLGEQLKKQVKRTRVFTALFWQHGGTIKRRLGQSESDKCDN